MHSIGLMKDFHFFRIEGIKKDLTKIGDSVKRVAYLFFQNLVQFCKGNIQAILWNYKNFKYLRCFPPFLFTSPPLFSAKQTFDKDFQEMLCNYQKFNGIKDFSLLRKHLNTELKKGFCHAKCLGIIEIINRDHCTFEEALHRLNGFGSELTRLELLEIFRANFQKNGEKNLLDHLQKLEPKGLVEEVEYAIIDEDLSTRLKQDLQNKKSAVVCRLYNHTSSHSVILNINHEKNYGFFNSAAAGYYEYENLDALIKAFISHISSHTSYLEKNSQTFWELSFFH